MFLPSAENVWILCGRESFWYDQKIDFWVRLEIEKKVFHGLAGWIQDWKFGSAILWGKKSWLDRKRTRKLWPRRGDRTVPRWCKNGESRIFRERKILIFGQKPFTVYFKVDLLDKKRKIRQKSWREREKNITVNGFNQKWTKKNLHVTHRRD